MNAQDEVLAESIGEVLSELVVELRRVALAIEAVALDRSLDRYTPKGPESCGQAGCDLPVSHRFTWPGRPRAGICKVHLPRLLHIAHALGLISLDLQEEPPP